MLLRGALGDGAGALVLCGSDSPDDEDGILFTRSGTDGTEPSVFHREAGGSTLPLNEETFRLGLFHWNHDFERMVKKGVPYFIEIIKRTLAGAFTQIDDVDFIIPAAANLNYFKTEEFLEEMTHEEIDLVTKIRSKTFTNFPKVGNVAAAAVYIALNELYEKGCLEKNTHLLLAAVEGATWGWGGSLFRWNGPTVSKSKTIAGASC
jgi:3-oxoacyl-[acyl-carrier-protein] synthase III